MSKEITRIEGFVHERAERIMHKNGGVNFAGDMLDDEHVAATLLISPDSTPPRVFTDPSELWVSVKDRLPRTNGRVIVWVNIGDESYATSMWYGQRLGADPDEVRADDETVQWRVEHGLYPVGPQQELFTHWQPVPGSPTL